MSNNNISTLITVLSLACAVGCGKGAGTEAGDGGIVIDLGGGPPAASFKEVEMIFLKSCGGQRQLSCHLLTPLGGGLDLTAANAYKDLVDITATISQSKKRVVPGDTRNSFLMSKLLNQLEKTEGNPMPRVEAGGSWKPLPAVQINVVRSWIAGGAQQN